MITVYLTGIVELSNAIIIDLYNAFNYNTISSICTILLLQFLVSHIHMTFSHAKGVARQTTPKPGGRECTLELALTSVGGAGNSFRCVRYAKWRNLRHK